MRHVAFARLGRHGRAVRRAAAALGLLAVLAAAAPGWVEAPFTAATSTGVQITAARYFDYDDAVAASTPWGHWRLDDTSGVTVADASGNGRDATYQGSPSKGQTRLLGRGTGSAVTLGPYADGDNITLPSMPMDNRSFSLEMWVKATPPDPSWTEMNLFTARTADTNGQYLQVLLFGVGSDLTLRADYYNDAFDIYPVSAFATHHVVVTYDATLDTTSIWVDGTRRGQSSAGPFTGPAPALWLSRRYDYGGSGYWIGQFDDVSLYQHALTAAEVEDHYVAGR